jgi:hypothetical protein
LNRRHKQSILVINRIVATYRSSFSLGHTFPFDLGLHLTAQDGIDDQLMFRMPTWAAYLFARTTSHANVDSTIRRPGAVCMLFVVHDRGWTCQSPQPFGRTHERATIAHGLQSPYDMTVTYRLAIQLVVHPFTPKFVNSFFQVPSSCENWSDAVHSHRTGYGKQPCQTLSGSCRYWLASTWSSERYLRAAVDYVVVGKMELQSSSKSHFMHRIASRCAQASIRQSCTDVHLDAQSVEAEKRLDPASTLSGVTPPA